MDQDLVAAGAPFVVLGGVLVALAALAAVITFPVLAEAARIAGLNLPWLFPVVIYGATVFFIVAHLQLKELPKRFG